MARCFSCGKTFDYEKYYGICPKCGAYNRENTPEQAHKELHKQYDAASASYIHPEEQTKMSGSPKYYIDEERTRKSFAGTVVFILLIIGMVLAFLLPFVYFFGRTISFGSDADASLKYVNDFLNEEQDESHIPLEDRKEQAAETVTAAVGETVLLGRRGELKVTVQGARVIIPAGQADGFPKGEKLVGISVNYTENYAEYYDYQAIRDLYVGYGEHIFKKTMESYDMEDYLAYLPDITIVDSYNITYGEGQGEILVFVPEEITCIDFYLESRDEKNFRMQKLYRIPLEIETGREL